MTERNTKEVVDMNANRFGGALRLTVGAPSCDVPGFTNVQVQCAIDRVASAGGGEVELAPGVYSLADSVHLRSGVTLRGAGEKTILRKNPVKTANVVCFLGFGHDDILVDNPDAFAMGDGVYIWDAAAWGFYATVGTLISRRGDTWFYDQRHSGDYTPRDRAVVQTLFSAVSARDVTGAAVEALAIDGNAAENLPLNGCRGGGVFAHRCREVAFRDLIIRDFHGEGISFQTCDDAEIGGCRIERCRGSGIHPGSGSNRFHIHHCTVRENTGCGLFYCLRVRDSVLEDCLFEANGQHGVSIGTRDTGHVNRRLTIRGNGGAGVYLRRCSRPDGPHNNLVEACAIEENCAADGEAEVVVQGATAGTRLIGNSIRRRPGKPGIVINPEIEELELSGNRIAPAGDGAIVDRRGQPADFEPTF
ncbi:MAG: right-handed parallel beta-helix repeat-containing protein [Lentisphaerae bacterium]|nr:right-handed parallel beta-helix repeat-containing protein [Lentisphaerota bacterium]